MIVTVADFRNNMAEYLRSIAEPIYLTRHGKVIGVVSAPNGNGQEPAPGEIAVCLHDLKEQVKRLDGLLREHSETKKSDR